jgi:hypothetical protein
MLAARINLRPFFGFGGNHRCEAVRPDIVNPKAASLQHLHDIGML